MQPTLPRQISSNQLAAIIGISERAVRLRAQKGEWPRVYKRSKGGRAYDYLVAGLPEEERTLLAARIQPRFIGAAAQAGLARAKEMAKENADAAEAQRQAREAGLAAYNRLPKQRQVEADARCQILQSRDALIMAAQLPRRKGTAIFVREYKAGAIKLPEWVEQACATRNGKVALSVANIYRWEKCFKEAGLAGLANGYSATRKSSIPHHMKDFVKGLLVDRPHLGIPTVRNALQARFEGNDIPSTSALRRLVDKWRSDNASLILYLTSPDEWRSRHLVAFGKADEQVVRLNQLWEFDSTPGDVMLVDGRHNLVGVIDVYSRRAKIQVTPTSKSAAIAALTRRAILDWGVPEIAKTDNGSDYVSKHMVRVFEDLEVWQELCEPFHPEQKPHIERFFKTLLHSIFELLPNYIGHSVADRKRIENRRSFAQRIMSHGEDPVQIAMTSDELQLICDRWCGAVYHQDIHGSLAGKTPAQVAREWTRPVRRITDERALDILLSPAPDKDGTRVVGKDGVQVQNGKYIAPELGPHVGKRVFVLLDGTDFGAVYVFLINSDGSKTFICRAIDPERAGGHDRSEIAAKAKAYQKEFLREGSKELRRLSKQAATDRISEEILSYRERKLANVHELPRKSDVYSTPAMEEAARAVEDFDRMRRGPQPVDISEEQDRAAAELIDMVAARHASRPLPATAQEKYEQIEEDLRNGVDVPDSELAWMKRYELYLETGERMAQQ